jgi:hypothetical protein
VLSTDDSRARLRELALRVVIGNHPLREREPFVPALRHTLGARPDANVSAPLKELQAVIMTACRAFFI